MVKRGNYSMDTLNKNLQEIIENLLKDYADFLGEEGIADELVTMGTGLFNSHQPENEFSV